jgi:hypothetical protein
MPTDHLADAKELGELGSRLSAIANAYVECVTRDREFATLREVAGEVAS